MHLVTSEGHQYKLDWSEINNMMHEKWIQQRFAVLETMSRVRQVMPVVYVYLVAIVYIHIRLSNIA